MKVAYKESLAYKVEQTIESLPYSVILRKDVEALGDQRQVTYALKNLIRQKKIARIGYGLYVKTSLSKYFPDMLVFRGTPGFSTMIREALDRLNIPWQESEAEEEYNAGRSTQIPVNSILRLKTRFRRKIAFEEMVFEYQKVA